MLDMRSCQLYTAQSELMYLGINSNCKLYNLGMLSSDKRSTTVCFHYTWSVTFVLTHAHAVHIYRATLQNHIILKSRQNKICHVQVLLLLFLSRKTVLWTKLYLWGKFPPESLLSLPFLSGFPRCHSCLATSWEGRWKLQQRGSGHPPVHTLSQMCELLYNCRTHVQTTE